MTDATSEQHGVAAPGSALTVAEVWAIVDAHEKAGRLHEAEQFLLRIAGDQPGRHRAYGHAGTLAWRQGRFADAALHLEKAIAEHPFADPAATTSGPAEYHSSLCELYRLQHRLDEAVVHGRRATELEPDNADAHYNLGVALYDLMQIEEAIACERRALALDPAKAAAHFELAEGLLVSGQFAEGWEEYEWRFRIQNTPALMPDYGKPLWDGAPMGKDQTLLLIADQGFGDTIQFCRYLPMVAQRVANVVVACSVDMQPIVRQQVGGERVFDRWKDAPAFDAYCTLSGLPRAFHTDLSNIPARTPYLRADPEKAARWKTSLATLVASGHRRIGLVWAGRSTHGNDFNRSISLKTLDPLMALKDTTFVSLQMGGAHAQIGGYFGRAPLINLAPQIADFTDTMAVIANLDMVVSVDTSVAHLTGALGKPSKVLLPFAPDWRWLRDRADTPWYPTMKLYRQPAPADWASAVQALANDLRG